MTEYYLVYRTEKGNPESATHAVAVEGVSQKLAGAIENEIKKRYGNETFDVVFFKKQKMSVSKALKLKHLVDAYENDHNGYYEPRWKFQRNRVLDEIESWIDDLKTFQDDPNVVWENSHSPPSVAPAETYYLYAGCSGGASACVKVAGKTQAIAAFRYASRKVEHLLDHDTCYGRGVRFLSELEVNDSNHYLTRDELEGVVLATQASLVEGMNLDDYDMLFIRAVIEFCQVPQSTFSIKPDSAGSPRMIQAARVKKKKETAEKTTFTKEEYKEFLENSPIVNAPEDVRDNDAIEAIKEHTAVLVEIFSKPIQVRDTGVYSDTLRANTDSKNPDERYRHWAKWKSGVGCTDIAKSENPEWESEYGREEAQRLWTSEADKIRKQVERFDKQLAKQPLTQNERKTS